MDLEIELWWELQTTLLFGNSSTHPACGVAIIIKGMLTMFAFNDSPLFG